VEVILRKKKVKQEIAYIDFLISHNNQKLKEQHAKNKSLKRPIIMYASVLSVLILSFKKALLVSQLKQGNY